jgi:hypothetical protein
MRIFTIIGMVCIALSITLKRFSKIPDFIDGVLIGCGIVSLIWGLLPNDTIDKIKEWKIGLIK